VSVAIARTAVGASSGVILTPSSRARLEDQAAGGFGLGFLEQLGAQVVAVDVVSSTALWARVPRTFRPSGPLRPSRARIEHQQDLDRFEPAGCTVRCRALSACAADR